MKNTKRVWKLAKTLKEMPHKTGNYLMLTDMGWPLTFYWDAHRRRCYILSNRNHYDEKRSEYVDDGKVDSVRLNFKESDPFAWAEIPDYDGEE